MDIIGIALIVWIIIRIDISNRRMAAKLTESINAEHHS